MKKLFLSLIIASGVFYVNAQTVKPVPAKKPAPKSTTSTAAKPVAKPVVKTATLVQTPVMKTNLDSASYAFGFSMGGQLKSGGLKTLNYDLLVSGLKDVFSDAQPLITQDQAQAAIGKLFEEFSKELEAAEKEKYADIINEGDAFLKENQTKPGIQVTASGLQYEVLSAGTGAKPTESDRVTVNYKGTLLNGTTFDSSYDRGEPTTFGLLQVIPGWTEGLQLMAEGAKYRFFVPYQLAYGSKANGRIPAYSTLIFEIELIKVED